MPCYKPVEMWEDPDKRTSNGKRLFHHQYHPSRRFFRVVKRPCGQCIGCRLKYSANWATRMMHEAQLYESNCFITLTFDPMFLPDDKSLDVSVFQNFMKRLRDRAKYIGLDGKTGIRFFHCGEYGTENGRPHYHAILFNYDFADKTLWKTVNSNRLYLSKTLAELWPFGFSTIGDVTYESAAYCSRYIVPRITGAAADDRYFDPSTGVYLKPEYATMSRNPGLAKVWFDKFSDDLFPHDHVMVNGRKCAIPKYYDNQLQTTRPYLFDDVKSIREDNAKNDVDNNTPDRLYVREQVKLASLNLLKRNGV